MWIRTVAILCVLWTCTANAATYYVRTDGGLYGTTSTTCNGQTDAAYSAGNGPNCAVNHPFEILGVQGGNPRAQRISAGDTVLIKSGSYKMGYDADIYSTGNCDSGWTYDCYNADPPSGSSSSAKTKIYGEGWSTRTGNKPELWGSGGISHVLNLGSASNVDVRWLDITDHDDCGYRVSANSCTETATSAYGRNGVTGWGGTGLEFHDVNTHGLGYRGFLLGKQTNLSMTDVQIIGNSFVGLDMDHTDHSGDNSWSGDNTFTRVAWNWNGCNENYPVDGGTNNCTDQNNAGYGDAWGSPNGGTAGNFTFTDTVWKYNVSDALDLLYLTSPSSTVTVDRFYAEGNVGNCIKLGAGNNIIRNAVLIHNCDFFSTVSSKGANFATCRGYDGAIVANLGNGEKLDIVNSTMVSQGDTIISVFGCSGTESINIKNNVIYGYTQWNDAGDKASWYYAYDGCGNPAAGAADYNNIYNVKQAAPCSNTGVGAYTQSHCIDTDPKLTTVNFTTHTFDALLQSSAPGIAYGLSVGTTVGQTTVPSVDYNNFARGAAVDLGALEYGSTAGSGTTRRASGGGTIAGSIH